MGLRPLWLGVRQVWLKIRDLILNLVWRTLGSPGHSLCPGLGMELAIQPHPGSNKPFPSTEASRVAFEIIGVTLACVC